MTFDNNLLESLIKLSVDKKNQFIRFLDELFKSNLILIKEIVIESPPTKYTKYFKKEKFDKDGKLITHQDYYLTGNLFYADKSSFHLISNIIQESKEFLLPYLKGIPPLAKMRVEWEYHTMKDIDLDNKASYWLKLILDILKTPTEKQINRALKYKKIVITTNTITDDNTKCIDEIKLKYFRGEHKMVLRIYGRPKDEQKTIDFF
ncbi:hypothetical protein [Flavobacterium phage FL-1]|nr:hypothetical protein [Flavobacterium phage FL-1]